MPRPKPEGPVPMFETNPAEIEALLEYLRQAYEDYLNVRAEHGHEVAYGDAFMAVHNFHKLVVHDLIASRGSPRELAYIAANIFSQAMQKTFPEGWAIGGLPIDLISYPKKGKADEET